MRERRELVRILLPILMLVGVACGPCNLLTGGTEQPTPPHPIVVSTEAAGQLESRIQQNLTGQPGQQFILRMTDSEVTSLVSTELAKYSESPLSDPQIWFTKGKIYGTGKVSNVLPIDAEIHIVASARIEDGRVLVVIEDVSAGAVPIPQSLLDTVSQSINETVDELQLDVQVTALEILEGEAIVQGVRR